MRPFSTIEDRHGVEAPGYQPPVDEGVGAQKDTARATGLLEVLVCLVIPIAGLGLAIWRFARGDVGPGIADLLAGVVGFSVATAIFL